MKTVIILIVLVVLSSCTGDAADDFVPPQLFFSDGEITALVTRATARDMEFVIRQSSGRQETHHVWWAEKLLPGQYSHTHYPITFIFEIHRHDIVTRDYEMPERAALYVRAHQQAEIDFMLAGRTSEIIVVAGDVTADRNSVSFYIENRYEHTVSYADLRLLRYDDGNWWFAPTVDDMRALLFRPFEIASGQVRRYVLYFGFLWGALEPGRYKLVQTYLFDGHMDNLIVEFNISS